MTTPSYRDFTGTAAETYQRHFVPAIAIPVSAGLLEVARLQPGERVLDVACGTGLVTFRAADAVGPTGFVAASDISEEMVASIAAAAAARGLAGDFRRMDAEALEHPDGGFDAVLCALGLMYVAEPPNALREMRRVLRPGGRTAAVVWGARRNCGWAEIFPIVERRTASDVCPMFFALGTGGTMADAFRTAGFTDVREERIVVPIVFPTADAAIGAAFIGGPVALAHARFDQPTRDSAYAEYLTSIETFRQGEAYHVPGEFVAVVGRA
jgi:ubiquinone/menaquinone biosynthesis C-methylase UbiE